MRTFLALFLIAAFCAANATFKDPRTNLKAVAPLTQEEVARQQALQKQQSEVGNVPQKTDETGYQSNDRDDPNAAAVIAGHAGSGDTFGDAAQAIKDNDANMRADAEQPKKMAFGAIWAILGGLLLAGAGWAGLQKFGPKPPEHLLRQS